MIFCSIVDFSGTISLGVILLALAGAAVAVWKTQSITALRQANVDLRADVADWKARYEGEREENDRLGQKIAELIATCQELKVQVARLQERTDTSSLAKDTVVAAFREEMRAAVARLEAHDEQKFRLLESLGSTIDALVKRNPNTRTRTGD